ncbi:MAG: pyridoxamine 5'-phosphate oxidase family protein [Aquirufa sp.]|jgi:hypothetical protein
MGEFYKQISASQESFIKKQHMYFVGTAPLSGDGHINVSPKGLDSFRVISPNQVAYLDVVSSGNETSAHMLENGRITIMFCSFDKKPLILKLYGKGETILPSNEKWDTYSQGFDVYESTRQIIVVDVELVQSSCGFGVPRYDFIEHRDIHFSWAAQKGSEGLSHYIDENNLISLDGLPTALGLERIKI